MFGKKYYIPCRPYILKFHDFDFGICDLYQNEKVANPTDKFKSLGLSMTAGR